MEKPFSQACANNQQPIFEHLKILLRDSQSVLEMGSGTGQHAVYFAERLPQVIWHTSDLRQNHAGINAWLDDYQGTNLLRPIVFDVNHTWPELQVDTVFSANTLHIMSWASVQNFYRGLPSLLQKKAKVIIYGPFNYHGTYTSDSNARFDQWLKDADPLRGIRDFDAVNDLAEQAGLELLADYAMPANNRLLVWQRV